MLAPLYLFFAATHPFALPPALARVMTPVAALTAVALLGIGLRARRRDEADTSGAVPDTLAIGLLVWLNVTVHVALSGALHEAINYGLIAIGAGAFYTSRRAWLGMVALAIASYAVTAARLPPNPLSKHLGFLMVSCVTLSIATFVVRRRAGVRLEALRLRDARQSAALAELSGRLQAVLDAMREGVLVIDAEGRVDGETSREATRVLGDDARAGASLAALLYPGEGAALEREALEAWLGAVFGEDPAAWEELESLAPERALLRREGGEPRPIALEFRPMVADGRIARVVVRARDESDKHALERAIRAQQEAFAKKLATMQRLVAGGGQALVAFLRSAEARLARARALLEREAPTRDDLEEAIEHVHGLKAEADAFEQEELRDAAHALEGALRASTGASGDALAEARAGAERVRASVLEARALVAQASPIGADVLDQKSVRGADVARLAALLGDRDDELGQLARRLAARPFGEIVGLLPAAVARWATREGKRAQVLVEGRDVLVPPALAALLGGVLGHLARNAVAHGFELPDARTEAGKAAHGELRLACEADGDGVRVVVENDGVEIAPASRARMFERGWTSRAEADALAGRGVGLSAASAELASAGYRIVLDPSAEGARFVIERRAP